MQILVFRHLPNQQAGWLALSLEQAGLRYGYLDLCQEPGQPLDIPVSSALVFLGGSMSANDENESIRRELYLIEDAIRREIPVLGICLGAQLIAKSLGARVTRNRVPEIGWFPVAATEKGLADPLLRSFAQPQTVFHWHEDTFELPNGVEWLASSDLCPNQAFRFNSNVYGLQFHLEVTPDTIRQWQAEELGCAGGHPFVRSIDPEFETDRLRQLAASVFGQWARMVSLSP